MQYLTFIERIKSLFTKKRVIWGSIIVLIVFLGWFFFIRKTDNAKVQTAAVVRKDIKRTVLTTGQVVSSTDLSLSFQSSGVVRKIYVKEGDNVSAGQVLAILDQGNVSASLESAKGALAQAKANYEKVKAAATAQDIAVSQAAVDSASVTLENAKQDLINQISTSYNNANTAVLSYTNILYSNPQSNYPQFGVSGTVQTNTQLISQANSDRVSVNNILSSWQVAVATLSEDNLDQVANDSLKNLLQISSYLTNILNILTSYTQITSGGSQTTLTTYQTGVATAKSTVDTSYTTILNDIQAIKTASYSLASAKASLALKQAPARPEDIGIAEAQVMSAQGQYDLALSALNNTVIVAPESGTITQVDIKLGEQATAMKEVIKLLNVGQLHTEAQVSEADIASIVVGQTIDNTFDALGPDKHFQSKVLTVNPASTLVSGVVNYKITGSLENIPGVRPGMTSNMTILVAEKKDVLVTPSSSIINQDGKKFVRVVDDPKTKTYHQVEVVVGLEADGGEVEVLSGLTTDNQVVTYVK
ncbi:MAG: HlyD family secretion protein [Parcubacteria bacterium C7867-006]|nr:MAG: HlyD family secretion protein [Parcubacteria bacterium C7867-006]